MAHICQPDFIITKKRKRSRLQAIDPCLGFYPAPSSSPRDDPHLISPPMCPDPHPTSFCNAEDITHTSGHHLTHHACAQPDLGHDIYRPVAGHLRPTTVVNSTGVDPTRVPHESQTTLTVEGFLRSAATVTTKRYRRRRGGRNMTKESESPSYECQQIKWTSDDEDYAPEKPAKKRQRLKKAQFLSARLLAAAVVTDVDVVGGLLFPASDPPEAQTSTAWPLPLSVGGRAPSPVDVARSRRHRFVDPRKVDHAVSQFARIVEDAASMRAKHRKPITAWKPQDHAVLGSRSGWKDPSGHGECFTTRPLTLVSSAHPRSAYQARCTTIISRSCPIPKKRKTESRHREPGPLERSRARSIANLPAALNGSHTQRGSSLVLPRLSPCASPALDASLRPGRDHNDDCDQSATGDPDITRSFDANIPSAAVAIPSLPTLSLLAPDFNLGEVLPSHVQSSAHQLDPLIALPPRSTLPKPLKPLGSLLNGFREIARNATQMANASQAHKMMRLRPNTSCKKNGDSVQGRSAYLSGSAWSRPSTAQPLPPSPCSVLSATDHAQVDVAASTSLVTQRSSRGRHGSAGNNHHLASSVDDDSCGRAGDDVDARPRTDRVDVLAILQSYERKTILLPSSPLPGWNALHCSTGMDTRDSEGEDNLYYE